MKREPKKTPPDIEEIERMGDRGENTDPFFAPGQIKPPVTGPIRRRTKEGSEPIQKINVDLTESIVGELDSIAALLNVSRQAIIKGFIKEGLDRHFLAAKARSAG